MKQKQKRPSKNEFGFSKSGNGNREKLSEKSKFSRFHRSQKSKNSSSMFQQLIKQESI
jgi:hypothetical protein